MDHPPIEMGIDSIKQRATETVDAVVCEVAELMDQYFQSNKINSIITSDTEIRIVTKASLPRTVYDDMLLAVLTTHTIRIIEAIYQQNRVGCIEIITQCYAAVYDQRAVDVRDLIISLVDEYARTVK
jgi:hypothetical protein